MQDLYEQLIAEQEAAIEQLVARHVQENVELEFKSKTNPSNGELTKDDRKNLGIALSAFSNSNGGVVIWGVDAKKNEDKVDCADSLTPITEVEKFKSEVERAISQLIMPRHDGIRVLMIKCRADPSRGYLAIQIDRSERRPPCEAAGEKQYFKRIGDSSIAMEHYDIEDSFKRFVVPSLQVVYRLSDAGRGPASDGALLARVTVSADLVNTSSVSARYPYLIITEPAGNLKVLRGFRERPGVFFGDANDVIHPDLPFHALDLECEFEIVKGRPNGEYLRRGTLQPAMWFAFRCGCLHSRPTLGHCEIKEEEVAAALNLQIV